MISGADLQGGSGLNPDYITLANDQITHLKPTTVTNLSAASIAIGDQGLVSFGNVTVGIGGVGTLYANGGLEATTMTVAGVGTISTLNVTNGVTCQTVVVNGGDDNQIDFSTADGASSPGATLYNDPYGNHFVVRLNGINRIDVEPNLITLNGNVLCGAMTASSATIANTVSCATLTTNEIDLSMPGLASHLKVDDTVRIGFTQQETQLHGNVSIMGNLTVSGTGGGTSLSAPAGSGLTIDGNGVLLNHDNSIIAGFDEKWPAVAHGTRMANFGMRTTHIQLGTNHFLARSMQRSSFPFKAKRLECPI